MKMRHVATEAKLLLIGIPLFIWTMLRQRTRRWEG